MKGYKGFNADMTCRGMQYEVGKTYEMDGELKLCACGYHFCETLMQCFNYYNPTLDAVYCGIVADGEILMSGDKHVTNRISIDKTIAPIDVWRAYYGRGDGYGDSYGHGCSDDHSGGNGHGYGDRYDYGDGRGYNYYIYNHNYRNIQKILIFKED